MSRSRAYNRDVSIRKAIRKRNITEHVYYDTGHPYYDNLHQYSKNKIHCSCPVCRSKTKNKGQKKHNCWSPSVNYKVSDKRKLLKMQYDEDYSCLVPHKVDEAPKSYRFEYDSDYGCFMPYED